jgi:anti-anti-sigma factor
MDNVERNPAVPLQMEVSWDGAVATVTVAGELDMTTATDLSTRLRKVAAAHPERLVLDLGGLVFIDVAGARALDAAHKALEAECPVILRGPRPSARKIFGLTGLISDLKPKSG